MINLLTSVNLPVIMLGSDLSIRRFTPVAEKVLNLAATDMGRSILHIRLGINLPNLEALILEVINTGVVKEEEVQDPEGVWYSMQIRPYRTTENRIEGVVLAWINIDGLKRSLDRVKESRDYAEGIVETVRESLIVLDKDFHVMSANRSFYDTSQTSPGETEGRLIYELGNNQWDIPDLRKVLEEMLPQNTSFQDLEIEHDFPAIGRRTMRLNAQRIAQRGNETQMILLAIEDFTERKRMEEALRQRTTELQQLNESLEERVKERTAELSNLSSELLVAQEKERRRIAYNLHDNVWQTLEIIKSQMENLFSREDEADWPAYNRKAKQLIPVIRDTVARVRSMQGDLWPSVLDDIGIVATLEWYCREFGITHPGLGIEKNVGLAEDEVPASAKIVIYRVMQEVLSNVEKHSQASHVSLSLNKSDHRLEFVIKDDGIGFDPEEAIVKRNPWGGLGLLSMKERTELSGGVFEVESAKGKGTTIRASWPLSGNN